MKKDQRIEILVDENAELRKENKKLKEELEKWKYGNSLAFDDIERICNEKLKLEEENRKLKEIMCYILYRTTKYNIKNVVYKGEKIEIGNGDYDYTLD